MSNVLERIEKLLRLANNSAASAGEAETALAMASKIALDNDIELSRVDISERKREEFTKDILHESGKLPTIYKYVIPVVLRFFKVTTLKQTRNRKTTIYFIGRKDNIDMARYVYNFLMVTFYNLWKIEQNRHNLDARQKLSFCMGLKFGLFRALEAVEKTVPAEDKERYSLMVQDESLALKEATQNMFKGVKWVKPAEAPRVNFEVYQRGVEEGKKIQINNALTF